MDESPGADAVLRQLMAWAEQQEAVRAMLLTSTRAIPGGRVDALSDYDIVLVVLDIHPFMADHSWPGTFGEVLVAYWDPVHTDPETGIQFSGNVVQYTDVLKIDFTFWPEAMLEAIGQLPSLPAELDAGYRVLVDKDGVASRLRAPTFTGYRLVPPDEGTYLTNVNDFFVGVPYVAKCLLREETLPAKWCLDYDMRYVYLLPMLEWRTACDHGWEISPGVNGKGLKRRLAPEIWAELEGTYAGAGIEENWESLFRMISLFRRVGREVGAHLGYTYPAGLDARVTGHVRHMQDGTLGSARPG
jgi:aminoglycoside 6-adenylyltransferase